MFVVGRVLGNEQLGSNSWEPRGECKWITAAHALLCWCTAASALGHLHSPRVETRRHDYRSFPDTRSATNTFSWYKNSISNRFPGITEKIIEIPAKRLGFSRIVLVPWKDAVPYSENEGSNERFSTNWNLYQIPLDLYGRSLFSTAPSGVVLI